MSTMTPPTVTEARAQRLIRQIAAANQAYYVADKPIQTDGEYDRLVAELRHLAASDPQIAEAAADVLDRPGGTADLSRFAPVTHTTPMLSLDNILIDGVTVWATQTVEKLARSHRAFEGLTADSPVISCGYKLDGISLSVTYEADDDGTATLTRAATRGDGAVGEDVTANALHVTGIPTVLPDGIANGAETIEVRGEVVMAFQAFETINAARAAAGEEPFAHPRSAAAGAMRQKDARETANRPLTFVAFDVLEDTAGRPEALTTETRHGWLTTNDFTPDPHWTVVSATAAETAVADLMARRGDAPWPTDGVVLKIDDSRYRDTLGATSRAPRWAAAVKPEVETATTTLTDVVVQVGRTGRATPRAVLDPPAIIDGVKVGSATLNNPGHIARLARVTADGQPTGDGPATLRLGATVSVRRAQTVIPEIIGIVDEGAGPAWEFPTTCPECGEAFVEEFDGAAEARCMNLGCPARLEARVRYLAGSKALDIDGLGPEIIAQLIDRGYVTEPGDVLTVTAEQYETLDRVGAKSAANLVAATRHAIDTATPVRVGIALSIRMNGKGQWTDAIAALGSVNAVRGATRDQLIAIDGYGPSRADALIAGLNDPRTVRLLEQMAAAGIDLDADGRTDTPDPDDQPLTGMKLVLTGTLDRPRPEIAADLEALGAKVSGSISGSTTALIAGNGGGSKATKAEKAGVPIVGQGELDQLLAGTVPQVLA